MPAEQYHAAQGVSRSMLAWIADPKTPAHYRAKVIDRIIPDVETPAMRLGTITHRAILESETMLDALYVKPDDMSFSTKAGKEWRDTHTDRPVITREEAGRIAGMRAAVWAHPVASRYLKRSEFERSLFVDDNGLRLKARFDLLPKSGTALADVKTCESASPEDVGKAIWNHGLFKQAAFYLKVANLLGIKQKHFVFIFVESSAPFCVCVYELDAQTLEAGAMLIARDLQMLRNCYESDTWPGYPVEPQVAILPAYAVKALEQSGR